MDAVAGVLVIMGVVALVTVRMEAPQAVEGVVERSMITLQQGQAVTAEEGKLESIHGRR